MCFGFKLNLSINNIYQIFQINKTCSTVGNFSNSYMPGPCCRNTIRKLKDEFSFDHQQQLRVTRY